MPFAGMAKQTRTARTSRPTFTNLAKSKSRPVRLRHTKQP